MKKTTIVFLFALLGVTFAGRSQTAFPQFPNTDSLIHYLSGGWTWITTCGGIAGGCSTPTSTGYSQQVVYSRITGVTDSIAYKFYRSGMLESQGHSQVYGGNSLFGANTWNTGKIDYLTSQLLTLTYAKADTVQLSDNCTDCYGHLFSRGITIDVGIQETSPMDQKLSIFPVPAHDRVTISTGKTLLSKKITLYSLEGKKVSEMIPDKGQLDVSGLLPGMYFIELTTPQGRFTAKMLRD